MKTDNNAALAAENEQLKTRLADLEAKKADETEILRRMSFGLTRKQAEQALNNQRALDARLREIRGEGMKLNADSCLPLGILRGK